MWLWCGVGAVVWIVVSIAVALLIGRMVSRADRFERVYPPTPPRYLDVETLSYAGLAEHDVSVS